MYYGHTLDFLYLLENLNDIRRILNIDRLYQSEKLVAKSDKAKVISQDNCWGVLGFEV